MQIQSKKGAKKSKEILLQYITILNTSKYKQSK